MPICFWILGPEKCGSSLGGARVSPRPTRLIRRGPESRGAYQQTQSIPIHCGCGQMRQDIGFGRLLT